jgi:hypothetical protein
MFTMFHMLQPNVAAVDLCCCNNMFQNVLAPSTNRCSSLFGIVAIICSWCCNYFNLFVVADCFGFCCNTMFMVFQQLEPNVSVVVLLLL